MNYINPFSLFEINSLERSIIQKAKKEKLTELALSKNHYIVYNEQKLNDDTLLGLADELLDPEWQQYHRFIHKNPRFSDFLEFGSIEIFNDFPDSRVFQNDAFVDFLMPYLSNAFPIALATAYHTRALDTLINIQENTLFLEFENPSFLFSELKSELDYELSEMKHAYQIVSQKNVTSQQLEQQLVEIRKIVHVNGLNALPAQLHHYVNSIALMCCSLSKMRYNASHDTENVDFFEFVDLANQLETNGHAKVMVDATYTRFKQVYYQRLGIEMTEQKLQWKPKDSLLDFEVQKALEEINRLREKFENPTVQKMGFSTRQMTLACSILQNISPPSLFKKLSQSDYTEIRQQVLSEVYLILSLTAEEQRSETLQVIAHYTPLYEQERHFEIKFEQLERSIQAAISGEILDSTINEPTNFGRALEHSKSKLDFLKEQLPPLPASIRQFFDSENENNERLAMFFPIAVTILLLTMLAIAAWKFLNNKHEMSEAQIILSERKERPWKTKDYTKEKFFTEKSKFIGNRLQDGATPFTQCFGESNRSGNNQLVFHNPYAEDVVACLYHPKTNQVIQQAYVAARVTYAFQSLPNGTYSMKLYVGKDWNPWKPNFCSLYGAFDTNPQYKKLKKKHNIELTGESLVVLPDTQANSDEVKALFFDLSARGFFNNYVREEKVKSMD